MPLDPQARAMLDKMQAIGIPRFDELPVPDARKTMARLMKKQGALDQVARIDDRTLPGPAGAVPVRIYTPEGRGPFPVLVFYHGGGWVVGSIETHDGLCRSITRAAGCITVSVEYRLAPEHRFPAAAEDAYAAAVWVAANAADIGGDPGRLAVGGDSAGGNLAAVISLMARDRGTPALVYQLLLYPVTDGACDTASYRDNAEGYFLTRASMLWFWDLYAGGDGIRSEAYASPLCARDFKGLPPALVVTAEFDPLRDEGEAYAGRLRAAGVPVVLQRYDGMIHGFLTMPAVLDQAAKGIGQVSSALRAAFGAR